MKVTQSLCPLSLLLVARFVENKRVNRVRISASVSVRVMVRDRVRVRVRVLWVWVIFRVWVRVGDSGSG